MWIDKNIIDFCLFLFVFLAIVIVTLDLLRMLVVKNLIKIDIHFVFHISLLFISILGFTLNAFFLLWDGAKGFDLHNVIRLVLAFIFSAFTVIILVMDQKDGFCRLCHFDYFISTILLTVSLIISTFIRNPVLLYFSCVVSFFAYIYILIQVGFIRIREGYKTFQEF